MRKICVSNVVHPVIVASPEGAVQQKEMNPVKNNPVMVSAVVNYRSTTLDNLNIMNDVWTKSKKMRSMQEKTTKM